MRAASRTIQEFIIGYAHTIERVRERDERRINIARFFLM
jgi:hypothetical protein